MTGSQVAAQRRLLTGWGRSQRSSALVCSPRSVEQVSELVVAAGERGVLARGYGRSYGDAALNAGGHVLAPLWPQMPLRWNEDGTVTAAAGVSLRRLEGELGARGRRVPAAPGTSTVSIGGAVAADVHGKDHCAVGSLGAWVRELELVEGTGAVLHLSPSRDPAAFWSTVGGMGLTGVMTSVTFEPQPSPTRWYSVRTARCHSLEDVLATMAGSDAESRVAWVDASGGRIRGVVDLAVPAWETGDPPSRRPLTAPRVPVSPLTVRSVRAFNTFRWRRTPADRTMLRPRERVRQPLDGVAEAHRLYGPGGFVQYQFVVPDSGSGLVGELFGALSAAHVPAFLAVLKKHGPGTPGPLSFPIAGWSLAVDLPRARQVAAVLDRFDERVAEAGGRVYLAKDSRLSAPALAAMYPRLPELQAVRDRLDPQRRFQSDLARRVGL